MATTDNLKLNTIAKSDNLTVTDFFQNLAGSANNSNMEIIDDEFKKYAKIDDFDSTGVVREAGGIEQYVNYVVVTNISDSVTTESSETAASSTAVKTAYDAAMAAIPSAEKDAASGVAPLDANKKVPSANLPLNTSVSSTSTTEAATPSAVKQAYDLAYGLTRYGSGTYTLSFSGLDGCTNIAVASQHVKYFGNVVTVDLDLHATVPAGTEYFEFNLFGLPESYMVLSDTHVRNKTEYQCRATMSVHSVTDAVSWERGFSINYELDPASSEGTIAIPVKFSYISIDL